MRTYVDDYGIGPWKVFEFGAGSAEDFHEYGEPVERSWRCAVATADFGKTVADRGTTRSSAASSAAAGSRTSGGTATSG